MKRTVGATILGLCALSADLSAQVELRSREHVDAAVEDASVAALRVAPEAAGGPARLISWDRVRKVEGASAAKSKSFEPLMEQLWRARTRVERGDFTLAEPLVDQLYRTYGAEEGPGAALVAECLLRCRLARGAQGAAATAWLWWTGLLERKTPPGVKTPPVWIGGSTDLPAVLDAGTHLAPSIPPIWTPGAATQAAATATEWQPLRSRGGNAGELAAMYEKAARFEAGLDKEITLDERAGPDPAVAIVREIVLARGGDEEAREAARDAIEHRLEAAARTDATKPKVAPMPSWMEAWLRMGLGRSLIRETDSSTRLRGVIELLHLPARFGTDQPNLAGIALADAAVTMLEIGDTDAAVTLKVELIARYPTHPVLAWDALAKIPTRAATPEEGRGAAGAGRSMRGAPADGEGVAPRFGRSHRRDRNAVIQKGPA